MRRRNPCAISMRVERIFTIVICRLQEMDLTGFLQGIGLRSDARAFDFGPARVQDQDRNIFFNRGKNGGRMQHLGAEVSHLGGFGEGDAFNAMAARNDARVGGKHAVDVGPDLNFFGVDAGCRRWQRNNRSRRGPAWWCGRLRLRR